MKKFLSLIASLAISASAFTYNFQQGWQLEGSLSDMNITQFKNANVVSVWTYDYQNQKWRAYFPNQIIDLSKYGIEPLINIKKSEGFWVNANGSFSIDVPDDDQVAYERGYQDGYNQGYQDGVNSQNSNNSTNVENTSSNNNDNYLSTHLIDAPVNFDLSDIAGKTFKLIDNNGSIVNIAFDNNGVGHVSFSNDNNYTLIYNNGIIKVTNDNDNFNFIFKKLKEDKNGIIVAGMSEQKDEPPFLDAWLNNITPVDMSTLNYPITLYSGWGDKITLDNNGTIEMPWGEDDNYTIQDGKIIVSNNWNDYGDDNVTYGGNDTDAYQIIDQIDRYYVIEDSYTTTQWMISSSFKGKTFDDIIGSNIQLPIEGYVLDKNGSVECSWYSDGNFTTCGTYQKISPTEIKIKALEDAPEYSGEEEDYFTETYTLDPDIGKITNIQKWVDTEIYSTSPIVKNNSNSETTTTTSETTERKLPMNLKRYYELKRQRAKKRIF